MCEWWRHFRNCSLCRYSFKKPVKAAEGHQLTSQGHQFLIRIWDLGLDPNNKDAPWGRKLSLWALEHWRPSNCTNTESCVLRLCKALDLHPCSACALYPALHFCTASSTWTAPEMAGMDPCGSTERQHRAVEGWDFSVLSFFIFELAFICLRQIAGPPLQTLIKYLLCAKCFAFCWEHETLTCGPRPQGDQKQ